MTAPTPRDVRYCGAPNGHYAHGRCPGTDPACTHYCVTCGKTRFGGEWMHRKCEPCPLHDQPPMHTNAALAAIDALREKP